MKIPNSSELMAPVVKALRDLGGRGSIQDIYYKVIENENIPDSISSQYPPKGGNTTILSRNLTWARTHLKNRGYLRNISRGLWELTEKGKTTPLNEIGRHPYKKN